MAFSLRDIFIGSKRIPSRLDYKFAMLRAEFSLLMIGVSLFYIVLDYVNGTWLQFIGMYILMIAIGGTLILLNRRGYYTATNFMLMITVNAMVFLFSDVDHPVGGVYFYYATASIAGLILFSKEKNPLLQWVFGLLPIVLGAGAKLLDIRLIPTPSPDPGIVEINFLSNFTVSLLSLFFIVKFLINRNKESEQSLIASEQQISSASDALRRSEERYLMALQGTRAGIYEWHVQRNYVEVSDHWKSILGYSPSEMMHVTLETFMAMVHPEDAARTSASVMNHVKNQLPYQNEVRLRTKDGEYRWFQDSGVGMSDASGALQVVIGSIIDINERKAAEEKVRQQNELLAKTNQELDYFVYSVSHDLRAPLSSILGLTTIYPMSKNQQEKDEIVKMISDRANVLDEFIREVLDYSRNARLEIKYRPVLLWEVVDEVVSGLSHMEGFGAIDLQLAVPSDLTIVTDRERLKVVLSNLLTNAIKYRDPGKKSFIHVRAAQADGYWTIDVEDNGIGIREEHVPKVFDMFYKAHDTSRGTGLGLYIANEAIQRLKGRLEVTTKYGEGSTFRMRIPVPESQMAAV